MATPQDKLIERVKKLLALAHGSDGHESALAMQRARELLAGVGMTVDEITDYGILNDKMVEHEIDGQFEFWETTLADLIACHMGCKCIFFSYAHSRTKTLNFIGSEANVKVAVFMFKDIHRQIKKASFAAWKIGKHGARVSRYRWIKQHNSVAITVLNERLKALKQSEETTTTAIVLDSFQKAQAHMLVLYPNVTGDKRGFDLQFDVGAVALGTKTGKAINLQTALAGEAQKELKG